MNLTSRITTSHRHPQWPGITGLSVWTEGNVICRPTRFSAPWTARCFLSVCHSNFNIFTFSRHKELYWRNQRQPVRYIHTYITTSHKASAALLSLKLWNSSPSTNDLSSFVCKLVTLSSRFSLPISLHPTHSLCVCSLSDKRVAGAPPWPLRERRSVTETVVPNQTQVEIGPWARINSELASTLVLWRAAQLRSDDP